MLHDETAESLSARPAKPCVGRVSLCDTACYGANDRNDCWGLPADGSASLRFAVAGGGARGAGAQRLAVAQVGEDECYSLLRRARLFGWCNDETLRAVRLPVSPTAQ